MPNLFPTFAVPQMAEPDAQQKPTGYRPSAYFDFELGDFRMDGSGRIVQATRKCARNRTG